MKLQVLNRKVHYWLSVFVTVPAIVIFGTGLLLQFKKQLTWVQPTEQRGSARVPTISFEQVLAAMQGVPEAEVRGWSDIDRLDVRPGRGMVKVRAQNGWEVQLDTASGAVLQVAYRRSDMIESLHDGSWFHDGVKYGLFVPTGIVLLLMIATGVYLFVLPFLVKARRRQHHRAAAPAPETVRVRE